MKIAFRADASLQIGTGHIMRCLTLAGALAARGAECVFICRPHAGNLLDLISSKGYTAHALPDCQAPTGANSQPASETPLAHSHWLNATQAADAQACAEILAQLQPDWLVVDHYALDARWEQALKPHYRKLLVIDDLADRPHVCDLLLDQTFGRDAADYSTLVPSNCHLLCGSQYALLRPEFAALRPYSLQRRTQPELRELLITMGGVDKDNATGQVLQALSTCPLPVDCRITVVMGATAPWLEAVRAQAQNMPWPTRVLVGVSNMAQLMADSDMAIGAAGATSWERCCLGLPTAMMVLAENQIYAARLLEKAGAVQTLTSAPDLVAQLQAFIYQVNSDSSEMKKLIASASDITDGYGCERVTDRLISGALK
jgi:UDP-2,4-diacetamido-2,4,6-trideoxy-beta-L-altropyranose hydrolase